MHLDSADTFTNVWSWEVGGISLTQSITLNRAPDEPMRWI